MTKIEAEIVTIERSEPVKYEKVLKSFTFDELIELMGEDSITAILIAEIRRLREQLEFYIEQEAADDI